MAYTNKFENKMKDNEEDKMMSGEDTSDDNQDESDDRETIIYSANELKKRHQVRTLMLYEEELNIMKRANSSNFAKLDFCKKDPLVKILGHIKRVAGGGAPGQIRKDKREASYYLRRQCCIYNIIRPVIKLYLIYIIYFGINNKYFQYFKKYRDQVDAVLDEKSGVKNLKKSDYVEIYKKLGKIEKGKVLKLLINWIEQKYDI